MAISAANIRIPNPYETMIDDLATMLRRMPSNVGKHDRAIVVILACIEGGVSGGAEIVHAGRRLGFNAQHFGMMLTKGAGNEPARHLWRRDKDGCYSTLEDSGSDQ